VACHLWFSYVHPYEVIFEPLPEMPKIGKKLVFWYLYLLSFLLVVIERS
jgi:hypothetical protein